MQNQITKYNREEIKKHILNNLVSVKDVDTSITNQLCLTHMKYQNGDES